MKFCRIGSFLAGAWVWILAVLLLWGCNGRSNEPPSAPESPPAAAVQATPERESAEDPVAAVEPGFDADIGFRDDGDPCREHRYRVLPGSTVTLIFEKRLPDLPEPAEVELEIVRDEWAEFQVEARVEKVEITAQTISRTQWGADFSGYAFMFDSQGKPRLNLRREAEDAQGVTGMKWLRSTLYVVAEINGKRWTRSALLNLTESDLQRICDGDAVFRYPDPNTDREVDFILQPLAVESEVALAQVEIEIILPAQINTAISRKELRFESSRIGRIALRLAYNPSTSRFITISGPADRMDCQ